MPEQEPPKVPRQVAVLWRPTRGHLLVAVLLLVFGLIVTMQIRSRSGETDYSGLRRTELVAILDDLTAESRRLEAEIAELRTTQQQLLSGADRQRVAREEAERRRRELSILSGSAPAVGEGIRVVIADPRQAVGETVLLNALEELRDAGAEVMEVNDSIRVVASSWIGGEGGRLVMDGVALERPFVIDAIGEPHALTEALRYRGGLVSEIQDDKIGGTVSIDSSDRIEITATREPVVPEFAKPA
ncbi:MAG: DUF881 domain-containing protein [Propionicimonas sp.]|jgi:uncharacterized protein YlxW (UPF0749 family)